MTSHDPKRLLDAGEATPEERDLLRSAVDSDPPPDARAAVWGALATRLPGIGGGGGGGGVTGGGGGAGTATGVSTTVKVVASIALAGMIAGGIGIVVTNDRAPATSVASSASASLSQQPTANAPPPATAAAAPPAPPSSDEPSPPIAVTGVVPTSSPPRAKAPPPSAPPSAPVSRTAALQEEAALLASAREALGAGNARRALSILDDARVKHPAGALLQEREVVAIEALAQAGDKAAAGRRAEAFLRSFPGSPHASHVRSFLVR